MNKKLWARNITVLRLPILLWSAMLITTSAQATNGLWLPGYGAKSIGMAGTSIAVPHDALAPASNPANIAGMGTRLDAGAGIFNPPRRAFVDATGSFFGNNSGESRSTRDWFLIPNIGYTYEYSEKVTLGFTAYGNGLGVSYHNNFYDFGGSATDSLEISLIQLLMPLTVAYQANSTLSYGASFVVGAQVFEAKGFGAFAAVSSDVDNLTDNGKSWSYGAGVRLGISKTLMGGDLRLGGYIASKVYMSEFDEYKGLIAEQGDLDVPASIGLGIAYNFTPKLMGAFDIVQIDWNGVASIGNKGPALFTGEPLGQAASTGVGQIGADDGMGFGWKDQTVFKVGISYSYDDEITLSTGINYADSPVPFDNLAFGVIGPAVTEKHLAFGYNQKLKGYTLFGGKQAELTVSFLHGFKAKMAGLSALGTNADTGQAFAGFAEFEMKQNELEVSYGLKF